MGFIFNTQVYNYEIEIKFDLGQNTPIIMGYCPFSPSEDVFLSIFVF